MAQTPVFGRSRDNRPAPAPTNVITTDMLASRTSLSFVPNVFFANSVSGSGDRRITMSPTARSGDDAAESKPATRWPTPSAAHTASTPIAAATRGARSPIRTVAVGTGRSSAPPPRSCAFTTARSHLRGSEYPATDDDYRNPVT